MTIASLTPNATALHTCRKKNQSQKSLFSFSGTTMSKLKWQLYFCFAFRLPLILMTARTPRSCVHREKAHQKKKRRGKKERERNHTHKFQNFPSFEINECWTLKPLSTYSFNTPETFCVSECKAISRPLRGPCLTHEMNHSDSTRPACSFCRAGKGTTGSLLLAVWAEVLRGSALHEAT